MSLASRVETPIDLLAGQIAEAMLERVDADWRDFEDEGFSRVIAESAFETELENRGVDLVELPDAEYDRLLNHPVIVKAMDTMKDIVETEIRERRETFRRESPHFYAQWVRQMREDYFGEADFL